MGKIALFLVVLVSLLAVACGGGGGSSTGETPTGGTTASPTAPPSGDVILLEFTISDTELTPHTLEIVTGKTYKFVVHNTSETGKAKTFVARRWTVVLPVQPGETAETGAFFERDPGETECHEQARGAKPEFQCVITIKPAG